MTSRIVSALAVCCLLLSAAAAWGQSLPPAPIDSLRPATLYLRAGTFETTQLPDARTDGSPSFEPGRAYVIQLDGAMTPARRAALATAGVQLGDYLPAHAYVADLTGTSPAELASLGFVQWVGPYRNAWKLDPLIGHRLLPFQTAERIQIAAQGRVKLTVSLFAGRDLDQAMNRLRDVGAEVLAGYVVGGQGTIDLIIDADQVGRLAEDADVQFVEEASEITFRNNSDRWIVQSNITNVTPLYDNGITGAGQIIGIMDGQIDVDHCSFSDTNPIGPTHRKIEAYNATLGADLHGTHVAGTAVGDAGVFDNTRGVAYEGRLVYDTVPSFTESAMNSQLTQHHDQGARIHTNSWGDDGTTAYNSLCRGIDVFSYNHEESLVLFAETNTSTLRNPENAKDLVAVGASQDTPNQDSHCSGGTGPTSDGRRKPEIYAPGCSTMSSQYNTSCSTTALTGTSMACPAVAGTAMLIRQYYTDGYYPSGAATPADEFTPSGALIKATLLNSAVDMTGISGYPSDLEGWGRVLADNALYFPGDTRNLVVLADIRNANGMSTNNVDEYSVEVTGSGEKLKVTLVWTDPAAASGASFAAINDLDLEVVSPGASLYRGNVFSGGVSVTGGSKDDRNNVEQVHLNSPATGLWTVRVRAAGVNQGTQGYALITTGDVVGQLPALTISLPNGPPTTMAPGTPTDFPVQVSPGTENVVPGSPTLHYRYDGGVYHTSPLVPDTGDLYTATLPGADCTDMPEFYLSAEGDGGGQATDPSGAPASVYSALVGEFTLAFDDTMETDQGWTVGYAGDNATTGIWNRMDPEYTDAQPEDDHTPSPGTLCWVTDGNAGSSLGDYDVDGGTTTLVSPVSDLSGVGDATISYWRWYSNDTGSNPDTDTFRVDVTNNGSTWVNVETLGAAFGGEHSGGWFFHEFQVADFVTLTANVQVRFVAEDLTANGGSLVEAAVDDFQISTFVCSPPLPGDFDGDGDVDLDDLANFVDCLYGPDVAPTPTPPTTEAECLSAFDSNADSDVDLDDFSEFQVEFTGP